ncbi:Hsp20/alpha crystallin family protein [Sulfurospirillum sp. 1612]|uniref:Hsp20/alpha crystallin family protein n=1 Tax=Sulfurospirillum sp. 1612 TaxID=3094835 RepID=UPI003FCE8F7F
MLIRKYNPFTNPEATMVKYDLVNDFMNFFDSKLDDSNIVNFKPKVNTIEGENAYHIEVDLPGVKKEEIEVNVKDNTLTISGERKVKNEVKEKDYYKMESAYGSFARSFTLPEKVDVENIHANSQDGVLEVVIPKLDVIDNKTKKIEIK